MVRFVLVHGAWSDAAAWATRSLATSHLPMLSEPTAIIHNVAEEA